ncbi:hypothetical protein T4A_6203 [Trichinella pseudospiralis]|uniref:Uncharacterized protein n=1 Tax=Trichinella pseudospiralis TaxID=6337 RepID=A0A0V1EMN8_TRIPS|nr:hypothetical protein T4A_6203 [Trichinella pseudospiralis]
MLTARLTSFRLRNANLTSIFNASVMQTDQVDWSSVGIVCCHLVSLSVVKLVTFRRWDSEKKFYLFIKRIQPILSLSYQAIVNLHWRFFKTSFIVKSHKACCSKHVIII